MVSQNKIFKTMNKIGSFFGRQLSQIQEGGQVILFQKMRKLFKLLWFSLFAPLAVYQKADWPAAYYFVLDRLLKQQEKICSNPSFVEQLAKVEKIESKIIYCIEKYIAQKPDLTNIQLLISASSILFNMCYSKESFERAISILRKIEKIRDQLMKNHQLDEIDMEFIPGTIPIGSFGVWENLEVHIKAGMLGLRTPKKLVLLLDPKSRVNNACYLNYWRKYITIISDPALIKILSKLQQAMTIPFTFYMSFHGKTLLSPGALGAVRKQWSAERHPPLLALSHEDSDRGWRCLNSFGVPKDAWFVCLHVREAGWNDNNYSAAFRNADIHTYFSAIKAVVDAGGWVIRMGDPGMTPLPPQMDRVIDYAHSDMKSDWMDVFLCANCRFVIGTASGLYTIAFAFGVPVVMTNCLPAEVMYQLAPNDIFISRICLSKEKNLYLSFRDFMSAPVLIASEQHVYDRLGLKVIENTPEEIRDVVVEMLERLNGVIQYSKEDEWLQEQFKSLAADCGELYADKDLNVTVHTRIGRDFLRKYASLLPSSTLKNTPSEVDNASL